MSHRRSIASCRAGLFAALLLAAGAAHSANGEWTTVASACTPDEASIGKWAVDGAAAGFAVGMTGDIVLRCNVTDPADWLNVNNPLWNRMDVTYNDPDGPPGDNQVVVLLRRVHESTGASSTVASFDSNLFAAGQQLKTAVINHVFDFYNYAYYLQVQLKRNASLNTRVQRVRLYVWVAG